ncbi:MAG: alpha/beta fold hydrolase [Bacteroidota bacterium]
MQDRLFFTFFDQSENYCISTSSRLVPIPPASQYFSEPVQNISLKAVDGTQISAWYLPDSSQKKAVILLNGLRGNRLTMVERAKIYRQQGYATVLPDLRGTGASESRLITFGWEERHDLLATVNFLQKSGYQHIAVHGISLGAATIAFSLADNPDYAFVVLESCYDNIDQALSNRIERFMIPEFSVIPLKRISEWRMGIKTEQLYPEHYLKLCKVPTLIMAGDAETRVKKEETEKLYHKCGATDKTLHFFQGAKHENFMNRYEEEFRNLLGSWLEKMELKVL